MPAAAADPVVPAACAVVTDEGGRVLLVRRARAPERGSWSIPGGRVEPGETLEQAAARETREETGLYVQVGRELWTLRLPIGDGRTYEIHDFAAVVLDGCLEPGDDADDVRWVAPDELDALPLTPDLAGYLRRAGVIPSR